MITKLKEIIFVQTDKVRGLFSKYLVAGGTDNQEVRKKHLRVGLGIIFIVVCLLIGSVFLSDAIDSGLITRESAVKKQENTATTVNINKLANGASNEKIWTERAEQEILDLKVGQQQNQDKQIKLEEYLDKESVSKKELASILKDFETRLAGIYESRLQEQQSISSGNINAEKPQGNPIEVIKSKYRVQQKKIGTYIPAGSYVEAKMISGVDAGIGMMAEADPRQVLLRVTGKVISAGFGKDYLTTNKLKGCIVQCQAVGDLSSEKAYLKPVVMTCAKNHESVIEIPIKGYATSSGKVGIRGEIVSREGDLVAKSFLSGLIGGIGSGVAQFSEPGHALSNGFAVKQVGGDAAKNILGAGLGKGINESSSRLSDYLIKRAEQYQPVISINEGVSVDLVFQEGFSINEEENVANE